MIAVESRGRLGNQMFQWAFAEATAQRLGTSFAMDPTGLMSLFTLGGYRQPIRRMVRIARLTLGGGMDRLAVREVSNDDDPRAIVSTLGDHTRYGGYFQSEQYFSDAADRVRAALTLHPAHRAVFEERYGALATEGYRCVHIRRGDYLTWRGGVALPWGFARSALERLPGAGPVVFVSEDADEARREFRDVPDAMFVHNTIATDLLLMIHARHLVISNSSFAWWGAWLGAAPGRRVIAPRHWLGFQDGHEWPRGVVAASWEQIDARPSEARA